jgi:putative copper export protein
VTATRSARHRLPGRLVVGGATAVVVAAAALLIGLYAANSEPTSNTLALTGPGLLVSWLLPLFGLMSTLSTVGCAGALLAAVVLLRTDDGGPLGQQGRRAIRDASNSAAAWAFAAFAGAVVTAAVLLSSPVPLLRYSVDQALGLPEVKALLITGILVTALAVGIRRANSSSAASLGVLVAVVALIPPAVTAYPRNESYVVLAGAALVIHVIAATTWIGGLAGLVRYGRANRSGLPLVLARFRQVALASSIILLVSGVISAVARLAAAGGGFNSVLDVLTSDAYGGLLIAKTILFIVLIIGGWFHRYHTIGNLTDTNGGFWRLVGGELFVMAMAIGLSVALSQTT